VESCRVVSEEASDWWRAVKLSGKKVVIGGDLSKCQWSR